MRVVREAVSRVGYPDRGGGEREEGGPVPRSVPGVWGMQARLQSRGPDHVPAGGAGGGTGEGVASVGGDGDRAREVPEPAVRRLRPARPRRPARGDADRRRPSAGKKSASVAAGAVALLPGTRGRLKRHRRTTRDIRNKQ